MTGGSSIAQGRARAQTILSTCLRCVFLAVTNCHAAACFFGVAIYMHGRLI